jgi:type IV secretion system protein VirD4
MTKPSELVRKLEKRAGQKMKKLKAKTRGKMGKTVCLGLVFLYFYGLIINSINRGIRSTFNATGEPVERSIWEFNPVLNWAAIFTSTGLAVTAITVIFIILFAKKGYHWMSGYRFDKDKRGFDILPDGTHGTSGWMKPNEMETVCDVGEIADVKSTLLGKMKDDPGDSDDLADYIGLKNRIGYNKNMVIFGSPGSGKSRGFVKPFIFQAARRKESLVLVDPKGEFYESMSAYLADEDYVVKCFNLIDMEHSDSFNCFTVIRDNPDMALQIAQIIMDNTQHGESKNPFWDISEQNLLIALLLYVSHLDVPIVERSIGAVYRMLSSKPFKDVAVDLEALKESHPAKAPFTVFSQAEKALWGNMASGLGVRLQVYANKMADAITCHDEIDFKLPGQKPCAYFCVIPDQDSSKAFLSTLFFQMLFTELYDLARLSGGGKCPVPVNVLMDEFCNVGKLPIVKVLSTARSRNIGIQIILQSLPQLVALYKKDESAAILNNCDTQVFLGCNDLDTAKLFSQKIGAITIRVNNNQMPMTPLFSPVYHSTRPYSQTRSNVERDLMKTDEVLRLSNEECLACLRGHKPLRLFKVIPDEFPDFTKLRSVKVTDHTPAWKKTVSIQQEKVETVSPSVPAENTTLTQTQAERLNSRLPP